ncbi:hypothetical protein O181_091343 [Austropuccinia psidii MF-1]|uniref:Uncharacterized protein n=1 Tax=Austropuccinia psidii MF-1 TaxID=1389203 RepID=A0A9Q3P7F6_9BASI|nr:hypothetical protein [Austropuccinia psidii MF-1]
MCIEEAWHQDYCTNCLPTWETLIAFNTSWTSLWNWIPGIMRGRRKRLVINRRSLQLVDPTAPSLPKAHHQKGLITGRTSGRIFKCPKTGLILLSSLRKTIELVL